MQQTKPPFLAEQTCEESSEHSKLSQQSLPAPSYIETLGNENHQIQYPNNRPGRLDIPFDFSQCSDDFNYDLDCELTVFFINEAGGSMTNKTDTCPKPPNTFNSVQINELKMLGIWIGSLPPQGEAFIGPEQGLK